MANLLIYAGLRLVTLSPSEFSRHPWLADPWDVCGGRIDRLAWIFLADCFCFPDTRPYWGLFAHCTVIHPFSVWHHMSTHINLKKNIEKFRLFIKILPSNGWWHWKGILPSVQILESLFQLALISSTEVTTLFNPYHLICSSLIFDGFLKLGRKQTQNLPWKSTNFGGFTKPRAIQLLLLENIQFSRLVG